jgi:hypothetical protein
VQGPVPVGGRARGEAHRWHVAPRFQTGRALLLPRWGVGRRARSGPGQSSGRRRSPNVPSGSRCAPTLTRRDPGWLRQPRPNPRRPAVPEVCLRLPLVVGQNLRGSCCACGLPAAAARRRVRRAGGSFCRAVVIESPSTFPGLRPESGTVYEITTIRGRGRSGGPATRVSESGKISGFRNGLLGTAGTPAAETPARGSGRGSGRAVFIGTLDYRSRPKHSKQALRGSWIVNEDSSLLAPDPKRAICVVPGYQVLLKGPKGPLPTGVRCGLGA